MSSRYANIFGMRPGTGPSGATYQQRVFEQGGQHAGTLHWNDGNLYDKSWVVDGKWLTGEQLDKRFGQNHQYVGLPGHTYGRMELTSKPEQPKDDGLSDLLDSQMKGFTSGIDSITSGMKANMEAMQKTMADQQAGYQEQLKQMTNVMSTANKMPQSRERILGVKGAGSPDAMTIRKERQGLKGTFGREGLRIKSLNV
tara:strand:- start:223 stop:816 length:594 start_codon:yes stop_codon:yes gene_type:complete